MRHFLHVMTETKRSSCLLLMDYQRLMLTNHLEASKLVPFISQANKVISTARSKGIPIGWIRVAFSQGHPEIRLFFTLSKTALSCYHFLPFFL